MRQFTSNEFVGESYIGNILADRFTCPKDQTEYSKCSFRLPSGYKKSKCIHKEDIWLKCETQRPANVINGTDHPIKDCSKIIISNFMYFIFFELILSRYGAHGQTILLAQVFYECSSCCSDTSGLFPIKIPAFLTNF